MLVETHRWLTTVEFADEEDIDSEAPKSGDDEIRIEILRPMIAGLKIV